MCRHVQTQHRIKQLLAVECDPTVAGLQQSRQQVDQGGLAGAGAAKQCRDGGSGGGKLGVQSEFTAFQTQTDVEHGLRPKRRRSERASSSAANNPASPSPKLIKAMRAAVASPLGVC